MLALQKCTQVSLYGFHWLAGHSIPHHYFNSEVPLAGKDSIHDYAQVSVILLMRCTTLFLRCESPPRARNAV
jgi:hypothetical protein